MTKLTQLMSPFDATTVQPDSGHQPLPIGIYNVMIDDSEIKQTFNGSGYYLRLSIRCIEGVHEGRAGFMNINIGVESEKAREIAFKTLSAVCRATGQMMLSDSRQLHGHVIRVEVALQAEGRGGEKGYTEVKRVIMRNDDQQTQVAPAAPAAPAQWGQAPAAPAATEAGGWGQAPADPGGYSSIGQAPVAPAAPAAGGWAHQPASKDDIPY